MQLTRQERLLIVVLIAALFIGSGISLFRRTRGISMVSPEGAVSQEESRETEEPEAALVVHVTGAVVQSGVYTLAHGARVQDAITAAGGLTADSDPERINLAAYIADGQQIQVPFRQALTDSQETEEPHPVSRDIQGKVRINAASRSELESLPGIGPVLSERIVAYRSAHGNFNSIDDLLNVSGIGEKKLADIQHLITLY